MARTINDLHNDLHLSLAKLAAQLTDLRRHITRLDGDRAVRLWREEWQLHEYMLILRRRIYHFAVDRRGDEVDSCCGETYRVEIQWDAAAVEESERLNGLRRNTDEGSKPRAAVDGRVEQRAGDSGYCSVCGTAHSAEVEPIPIESGAAPTPVKSSEVAFQSEDYTWVHCWLACIPDHDTDPLGISKTSGEVWCPPPNRPFPPACDSEGWTEWNEDCLAQWEDREIDGIVAAPLEQTPQIVCAMNPGAVIGDIWDSLLLPSVPSTKEPEELSLRSESSEELFSLVFTNCGAVAGCAAAAATKATAPTVSRKYGLKRQRSIPKIIQAAVRVFA